MKTKRELDSLLRVVRENPPVERLVSRDEVRSMIDDDHARPAAPITSPQFNWRLAMTVLSILAVAGVVWFTGVVGGDDPVVDGASPKPKTAQPGAPLPDASTSNASQSAEADSTSDRVQNAEVNVDRAVTDRSKPGNNEKASDGGYEQRLIAQQRRRNSNRSSGVLRTATESRDNGAEIANIHGQDTVENGSNLNNKSLDINSLGYIELTADEARKIGIEVVDGGFRLFQDALHPVANDKAAVGRLRFKSLRGHDAYLVRRELTFGKDISRPTEVVLDPSAQPLAIAPVYVVRQYRNRKGHGSSIHAPLDPPTLRELSGLDIADLAYNRAPRDSAQQSMMVRDRMRDHPILSRLVTVLFRLGDSASPNALDEVCLWYVPTKAFIAQLPDRYRSSLEGEVTAIAQVSRVDGTVEQACDKIAGRPSYLDVCRISSGAISGAVVHPNPASVNASATLSFLLKEDRIVTLTIHELSGRYVRHLAQNESLTAGQKVRQLELAGFNRGAYLIAVRTDRGEQAVARLLVQ